MANLATNSTTLTRPIPEPSRGFDGQPQKPTQRGPYNDWETIGGHRRFYNEQDYFYPARNLSREKIKQRELFDVVFFKYSLSLDPPSPEDRGNSDEEASPSSGDFSSVDDKFFQVSKDQFMECDQFDHIFNPVVKSRRHLGIIDFPQCYDTSEVALLDSMAYRLRLLSDAELDFWVSHKESVLALPGDGYFRTGILFSVPLERLLGLGTPPSSEDRFTLFVSFPYLGNSAIGFRPGFRSESVGLLDFKTLGVRPLDRGDVRSEGERDDIREIVVHQARYMIIDNYTMVTFRSKEDSAKDEVPLYRFQGRICAFHAMIQMISNHTDSESRVMEKLQSSLWKLDQIIADEKCYESEQKRNRTLDVGPELPPDLAREEKQRLKEGYKKAQQKSFSKEQGRGQDLISFNKLLVGLFAVISVAERQIEILQDIRRVFSATYPTSNKAHQTGHPRPQNALYGNAALIPALPECTKDERPDTLDIIDKIVRERKSVIAHIRRLVGNMDIKRKILVDMSTKGTLERQSQTLSIFTVVTTAFLPLSFCTSYFGMNNIKEFNTSPISRRDFWSITGPTCAGIILLTIIIIFWQHQVGKKFTAYGRKIFAPSAGGLNSSKRRMFDLENQVVQIVAPRGHNPMATQPDGNTVRAPEGLIVKICSAIKSASTSIITPQKRKG
ncbi:unnamed protein product [Tuber aestivum]|uniref:Uncharacterized protein n=1 Tax=Tuber aestivum TaxID=59557 RepID=A0A292PZ75_9PEZI|nr:unnamed protein product [Tuber aestivum]